MLLENTTSAGLLCILNAIASQKNNYQNKTKPTVHKTLFSAASYKWGEQGP